MDVMDIVNNDSKGKRPFKCGFVDGEGECPKVGFSSHSNIIRSRLGWTRLRVP
jgi:hypothetical protein